MIVPITRIEAGRHTGSEGMDVRQRGWVRFIRRPCAPTSRHRPALEQGEKTRGSVLRSLPTSWTCQEWEALDINPTVWKIALDLGQRGPGKSEILILRKKAQRSNLPSMLHSGRIEAWGCSGPGGLRNYTSDGHSHGAWEG